MNRRFFLLLMLVWIANAPAFADDPGAFYFGSYLTKWQPLSPNLAVKFRVYSEASFEGDKHSNNRRSDMATDDAPSGFSPSYAFWIFRNTGTCTLKPFQFRAVYSFTTEIQGEYETVNRDDRHKVNRSLKPGEICESAVHDGGAGFDHRNFETNTNGNHDKLKWPMQIILDSPLECEPENKK